jgi:hypothetical protein
MGISSSNAGSISPAGAGRRSFALNGRSTKLDPVTHAVRPDLADIRLADQVFAPHYAAPLAMVARHATPIRSAPELTAEIIGTMTSGDVFEVLDLSAATAWGVCPAQRLVGYVDRAALAPMPTSGNDTQ